MRAQTDRQTGKQKDGRTDEYDEANTRFFANM